MQVDHYILSVTYGVQYHFKKTFQSSNDPLLIYPKRENHLITDVDFPLIMRNLQWFMANIYSTTASGDLSACVSLHMALMQALMISISIEVSYSKREGVSKSMI